MKFTKQLVRPNLYRPTNLITGERYDLEITQDRVRKWYDTAKRMLKKGLKITVPYGHSPDAVPVLSSPPDDAAYKNAGFVTDVRLKADDTLEVDIEAATDDDAEILGKKVQGVSLWAEDWEDGDGQVWKDAIRHVAATNHPVMIEQDNFQLDPQSDVTAVALAMAVDAATQKKETKSDEGLEPVLSLLAECVGIELPDGTTPGNFLERLQVALNAVKSYKATESGDATLTTPPTGATSQKPTPIAMSKDIDFLRDTLVAGTVNPDTNEPWKLDELVTAAKKVEDEPVLAMSAHDKAAIDAAISDRKSAVSERLKALVKKAIISKEKADELQAGWDATPVVFGAEAALIDKRHGGKPAVLEVLELLETMPAGTALNEEGATPTALSLDGMTTVTRPDDGEFSLDGEPVSDEKAEKNANDMLRMLGKPVPA